MSVDLSGGGKMVFVSRCLLGENCKYNGGNNLRAELKNMLAGEEIVLICPECDGGMSTPRNPSEIENGKSAEDVINGTGKVLNSLGDDVTESFILGAKVAVSLANKLKPSAIYLKQGSPSCGCGKVYDGTFSNTKKTGNGITTQMFLDKGFKVIPVE